MVEGLLDSDCRYDLLSGNAGAALVFLNLYETLKDPAYIAAADRAVAVLVKRTVACEKGVGWIVEKDTAPMSGAAHGNSGILLP